jgi:hypothetical protein
VIQRRAMATVPEPFPAAEDLLEVTYFDCCD